uniref:Uncharacterized protein n=1 Tax=Glossina pallidipes TaxID=7398 RepID=A0A1B0ABT3_GLOPL
MVGLDGFPSARWKRNTHYMTISVDYNLLTIVVAAASPSPPASITYTEHLTNIVAMYATQSIVAIMHNKEGELIIPAIARYFSIYFNRLINKLYVKSKTSSTIPSDSSVLAVTSIAAVTTIIATISVITITVWISIIILALIIMTLNKFIYLIIGSELFANLVADDL